MSAVLTPPAVRPSPRPIILPPHGIPGLAERQYTVAEYHRLIQANILKEGEPYELLEGWIVPKLSRNAPHDFSISLINRAMRRLTPDVWHCRCQCAATLSDSEPEPDGAIVRGPEDRYATSKPTPADTAVVIEVSDSTLDRDRAVKGPIYAAAGIPVYWIVNVQNKTVEVYADPTGPDADPKYRTKAVYGPADAVPLLLPGEPPLAIPVPELVR